MDASIDVKSPIYSDQTDARLITPKVNILNPKNTENLAKIIDYEYKQMDHLGEGMIIDLSNVKILTNLAARMLCKVIYGRDTIKIENTNEAVYSSLEWAADYLYRKGELDQIPWQISEMFY